MEGYFNYLLKVQDVYKDIKYLQDQIDNLPKKINENKKNLERSKKNIENLKVEIETIEKEIETLEIKLEEEEKKKNQYENSDVESYKTAEIIYDDLTDTIANIEKNKKEIEKRKALRMECQNKIKSEENIISNITKDIEQEEEFIKVKMDELINELKSKEKEKNDIYNNIPKDIMEKFERILHSKNMKGIVPLFENYCSGCNMILPAAFSNKVKLNKDIVFCPYCSRILYYEENEKYF